MGLDSSHLAAALSKAQGIDRSPNAVQRLSEVGQDQLAAEAMKVLGRKKTNATDHLEREKIRHDRERRRREMERRRMQEDSMDLSDLEDGPMLDVIA